MSHVTVTCTTAREGEGSGGGNHVEKPLVIITL